MSTDTTIIAALTRGEPADEIERRVGAIAWREAMSSPRVAAALRSVLAARVATTSLPLCETVLVSYLRSGAEKPTKAHADIALKVLELQGLKREPVREAPADSDSLASMTADEVRALAAAAERELAERARPVSVADATPMLPQPIDPWG